MIALLETLRKIDPQQWAIFAAMLVYLEGRLGSRIDVIEAASVAGRLSGLTNLVCEVPHMREELQPIIDDQLAIYARLSGREYSIPKCAPTGMDETTAAVARVGQ